MCVCVKIYRFNLLSIFLFLHMYGVNADHSALDSQQESSSLGEANSSSPSCQQFLVVIFSRNEYAI